MTMLALKAKALLDAVDFDQHGRMVAGKYVGGNGGLISRPTIVAADELRKALEGEAQSPFPPAPTAAQLELAYDFCAKINAEGWRIEPGGLLDMAKRLYEAGGRP